MKFGITERGDAGLNYAWNDSPLPKILITKSPSRLRRRFSEKTISLKDAIIHCTITGFGGGVLEPGVNEPKIELEAYKELIQLFGGERVILRVDPIIPTSKGIEIASRILSHAEGRIRISFLDAYPHARARFAKKNLTLPWEGLHAPLEDRISALQKLQEFGEIEICGEPGLSCTGCISDRDIKALGLDCKLAGKCTQRKECQCSAEKTELLSNKHPCQHNCLYCYWK